MEVFLSWSGERSRRVAQALERWLPSMIQAVDPWISLDIEKGVRWNDEISTRLERSRVGILCLTRDNLTSPWILFEAGALSKQRSSRAMTLLIDLKPADVSPPLSQFQHTLAERDDIRKLLHTINAQVRECGERAVPEHNLNDLFDRFWNDLEKTFEDVIAVGPEQANPVRDDRDILAEMLELIRGQERQQATLLEEIRSLSNFRRPVKFRFPGPAEWASYSPPTIQDILIDQLELSEMESLNAVRPMTKPAASGMSQPNVCSDGSERVDPVRDLEQNP